MRLAGWPSLCTGDERSVFIRTSAGYIESSAEQGSHHAARLRSYLSASPVMVVTEHFVLVRRRHAVACPAEPVGIKGIIAEGLLRALMIYLLQLASYGLAEILLSFPPDDGWRKRETLNKASPLLRCRAVNSVPEQSRLSGDDMPDKVNFYHIKRAGL